MKENLLLRNLKTKEKVLFIGVGNTSRGDDALGWDFVSKAKVFFPDADLEYKYQLQVEDSELFSWYNTIIIGDASHEEHPDGFEFKSCQAAPHYYFSSHAQHPDTVLHLTHEIFKVYPSVYVMAISGYQWDLSEGLSNLALQNLNNALSYFKKITFEAHDPSN
jgi:hydrogenase maturation protease